MKYLLTWCPMLMKAKKIVKFENIEKKMVWRSGEELPTKFGLDPCSGLRETWVCGRRTDGRTKDACATTVALLTKSSRAKDDLEH